MRKRRGLLAGLLATTAVMAFVSRAPIPATANEYFTGKQIRIVNPAEVSGAYSLYLNLAVQHLGRFIPGNPTVVPSHMPGAAGLVAMNYLYEVAPRDGTVISVMRQDLAARQALGEKGVRFDATKFNYVGRATTTVGAHMVWHTAPAQSIDELKNHELVTAATGTGGSQNALPRAQNALLGTRWRIISGYPGYDSMRLALERGEVHAMSVSATLFNERLKPWLTGRKVKVIVQYADFRHPTLADVPAIVELAKSQEAKDVFKFLVSYSTIGRSYAAPPGVPVETLAILRKAFTAMINDPAFRADAEKWGADIYPMSGEELAAHIRGIVATPPDIIRKTNEVVGAGRGRQ
jgi:tripartite-type tricarboxylate transporter receptor subunit TctC